MFETLFMSVYVILMLLIVAVIPKGMLTTKIYKQFKKIPSLPFLATVECYTPLQNSYIIRRTLYGSSPRLKTINIVSVGIMLVTILVRVLFPVTEDTRAYILIQLAFTLLMVLTLLVLYVVEVAVSWDLCNLMDCRGYKFWAILMPPLCNYLLSTKVDAYTKRMRHVIDGTFHSNAV